MMLSFFYKFFVWPFLAAVKHGKCSILLIFGGGLKSCDTSLIMVVPRSEADAQGAARGTTSEQPRSVQPSDVLCSVWFGEILEQTVEFRRG